MADKSRLLIIDNMDSFTYNLVQMIEELGCTDYRVIRSNHLNLDQIRRFSRILISPGPGLPGDFPQMCRVIEEFGPSTPILGICLGHQAIAEIYGGRLNNLDQVNHGITTTLNIICPNDYLFEGLSSGEKVGLYHSWEVDANTLPESLEVTSVNEKGAVLSLRHREYDVRGVQFHPESMMTPSGSRILKNWLCKAGFFFLLFISCQRGYDRVDTNLVFRYNEAASITSLDPAFARDQANIWVVNQLFNGLAQLNDKMEVLPCIARSWDVSEDGLQYLFHLRGNVFFQDDDCFPGGKGRAVKASDFIYSFKRICNPETVSPGAWVFNNLDSVQPFQAINDSTLIIRMARPFPPFLGLLTMQYCTVIPEEAILYYGSGFRNRPVGTGPFHLAIWKEGVKLVLKRNPRYFEFENGRQLPFLEAVSITFLADKQAAFLQFVQGKLDFMSGIDPSYKDELLTSEGTLNPKYSNRFHLITQPYLNTEYLGILVDTTITGVKTSPLKSRLFRQAINYAFDRHKMIAFLRNNIGTPGTFGIIPPGMPGFDSSRRWYDYQPDRTRVLLEQAGYKNGIEMPPVTLVSTPDYLDVCKYIQHEVSEAGIVLNIEVNPPAAVKEMKAMAKIPFFRASWIADYPDAENYLSLFYSPNFCPRGPNYTHYSNPTYDRLFEAAMSMIDDSLRFSKYRDIESLMMEDSPVIILYYDEVLRFVANNVHGIGSNPMNLLILKRVLKD
ncbi:MAG: ABC transporter substrate-binding protein [bacterium]